MIVDEYSSVLKEGNETMIIYDLNNINILI